MLFLTATPFSIEIDDLQRLLRLIRADGSTLTATRVYAEHIRKLWDGDFGESVDFAEALAATGIAAVRALRRHVIRHSVERLIGERHVFGRVERWKMPVPAASEEDLEILVRADRLLGVGKSAGTWRQLRTNDPRFHEGWAHLRAVRRIMG
jgi:hypothetical protein